MALRPIEIWQYLCLRDNRKGLVCERDVLGWFQQQAKLATSATGARVHIPELDRSDVLQDAIVELVARGDYHLWKIEIANPDLFSGDAEPHPAVDGIVTRYVRVMIGNRYLTIKKKRAHRERLSQESRQDGMGVLLHLPGKQERDLLARDQLVRVTERAKGSLSPSRREAFERVLEEVCALANGETTMKKLIAAHQNGAEAPNLLRNRLHKQHQRLRDSMVVAASDLERPTDSNDSGDDPRQQRHRARDASGAFRLTEDGVECEWDVERPAAASDRWRGQ